jgi:hypothetical protein
MNLDEFRKNFIDNIRIDSEINGDTPSNVFLNEMIERLEGIGVLFNSTVYPFSKNGSRGKLMRIDGYSFDEADKSLILFINDFIDDDKPGLLNQSSLDDLTSKMLQFIKEVYSLTILDYLDSSLLDIRNFSTSISHRLKIDYVKAENDDSIEKIKFIILTNKKLTNRKIKIQDSMFVDKLIEVNVWDIERIFDLYNSNREREPLLIDFQDYDQEEGIPFIQADFKNSGLYDAFLCIVPGKTLSDIYYDHGSRLLEGNVRTFLSIKGKINKSIRETIKSEPSKFFAYNNGISCTASRVVFSSDKTKILKIEDLQIINGGQTTASLSSADRKDKANLDLIYVPMKLTIIKTLESEDNQSENYYETMIQNIARYANSQNKVKDSDFFSNHPFHRVMEQFSRKIAANPQPGALHSTYWFYERTRGAYDQAQFKFTTQTQKDEFQKKFPKNQLIKKEDLAKYMMASKYQRPDIVSKGSEKNMAEFASIIDEQFMKSSESINETFFKRAVVYSMLYKKLDNLISRATWYYTGGPKLNVIPYTLAKFFYCLPEGYYLDLDRIWEKQQISDNLAEELLRIAEKTLGFILNSDRTIVTEYAKKQDTWEKYKAIPEKISQRVIDDLISTTEFDEKGKQAVKQKKMLGKLELEIKIMELAKQDNGQYWLNLVQEGERRKLISQKDKDIVMVVNELGSPNPKRFPSPAQMKVAWEFRSMLEDAGALV